jgi:glucose-6-phosphate 1-epimerase
MSLRFEHIDLEGRPHLRLMAADGACAEISLHGAHVTSWRPAPGRERLYLSPKASRAPGKSIRGGIPVIFPQFAGRGAMIKHGFARLLDWRFQGIETLAHGPAALFEFGDSPATHAHWPCRFHARLHVALGPSCLEVGLEIRNADDAPFSFTAALHTYLRVDDLADASLHGLEAAPFLDSTRGEAPMPAAGEAVRFGAETDRVYPDAVPPLTLRSGNGALRIDAQNFRDTIVWNPGPELAASIADLGAGEHRHFVCVESGTVIEPVVLAPGERWLGVQRLQEMADSP